MLLLDVGVGGLILGVAALEGDVGSVDVEALVDERNGGLLEGDLLEGVSVGVLQTRLEDLRVAKESTPEYILEQIRKSHTSNLLGGLNATSSRLPILWTR